MTLCSQIFYHSSFSDVLVGAFVVLGDAIHSTLYGEWYGGDAFCRIYRYDISIHYAMCVGGGGLGGFRHGSAFTGFLCNNVNEIL